MELITKEMLADLISVAKTSGSFLSEQAVDVVNQALNYALFEAVIALIGTLSIYLIYYIVAKIIAASEEANKIENTPRSLKVANALKTGRQLLLILFTAVVIFRAQDSIRSIGKITISPKVYLLEEGAKILQKIQR